MPNIPLLLIYLICFNLYTIILFCNLHVCLCIEGAEGKVVEGDKGSSTVLPAPIHRPTACKLAWVHKQCSQFCGLHKLTCNFLLAVV